jgi:hypothetical protein
MSAVERREPLPNGIDRESIASVIGGFAPSRRRAVRDGLLLFGIYLVAMLTVNTVRRYGFGYDAHAYWSAWRHHELYTAPANERDAYLYSPAFAQAIWPLTRLPWPAFAGVWTILGVASFAWLLAPVSRARKLLWLVLVVPSVIAGNIWPFFAIVLVVGFRWPAAWALPLLTKITAAVGLIWFGARREWRSAAYAVGAAAVIVGISVAFSPGLWGDWIGVVHRSGSRPLYYKNLFPAVRVPIGLALAVVAARTDRKPLLAWSMLLACPVFSLPNLGLLAAIPRLSAPDRSSENEKDAAHADNRRVRVELAVGRSTGTAQRVKPHT